jgi:hypothetical protein
VLHEPFLLRRKSAKRISDKRTGATGLLWSTYLAFGHGSQRLDHRQFHIYARRLIQELHHRLDHPRCGLFELSMFLGEQEHLVIEEIPVARVFGDCDDGDKNP